MRRCEDTGYGALLNRRAPNQGKANLKARLRTAADLWRWGPGRTRTVTENGPAPRACVPRTGERGSRRVSVGRLDRSPGMSESHRNAVNATYVTPRQGSLPDSRGLRCEGSSAVHRARAGAVRATRTISPARAGQPGAFVHSTAKGHVWWILPGGERAATSRALRGIRAGPGPLPREGPSSCLPGAPRGRHTGVGHRAPNYHPVTSGPFHRQPRESQ